MQVIPPVRLTSTAHKSILPAAKLYAEVHKQENIFLEEYHRTWIKSRAQDSIGNVDIQDCYTANCGGKPTNLNYRNHLNDQGVHMIDFLTGSAGVYSRRLFI